jgi:hypothetical protein
MSKTLLVEIPWIYFHRGVGRTPKILQVWTTLMWFGGSNLIVQKFRLEKISIN